MRQSASNGVEAQAAEWLKAQREAPEVGAERKAKERPGCEIAERGRRKATQSGCVSTRFRVAR